jgi:hypothetical protein
MSRISFAQKTDALNENMRACIRYFVAEKGIQGKHTTEPIIPTKWDDITEIAVDHYKDQDGLQYSFGSIPLETLAQVADFVTTFKKPKVK